MAKFESLNQVLEKLKNPENQDKLRLAVQKKYRTKVHAETITNKSELHEGHRELKRWIKEDVIKNAEVFDRFEGLMKPPFVTNELTESIFDQFSKVFNAKNSHRKVILTDSNLEQDAYDYLDKISYDAFWKTKGYDSFKSGIDDIIIVDLPQLTDEMRGSMTALPTPYAYILDITDVYSIGLSCSDVHNIVSDMSDGTSKQVAVYDIKVEHIAFRFGGNKMAFFSDDYIRVFNVKDKQIKELSSSDLEYEEPILIGYCPAKQFGVNQLNSSDFVQKKGQITNSLSNLDYLFMYHYMMQYHDLYGAFPIISLYSGKCDYRDENGVACTNGYIYYHDEHGGKQKKQCPKCKNKVKLGPGNIAEVKTPQDRDQFDLLDKGPVKIIEPSVSNLEWVQSKVEYYKDVIFKSCVGKKETPINNQAVNEKQVDQIYESEKSVLYRVKRSFEIVDKWTLDTIMLVRYGDNYTDSVVSWGTPISSNTELDSMAEYKLAKESGLPVYDLAERRETLYNDKYRENPDKLKREKILSALEPFQDMTVSEVLEHIKGIQSLGVDVSGMVQDLKVKMNFVNLVKRFEREAGSILLFASALSFDKKIDLIKYKLYEYDSERKETGSTVGGIGQP